MVNREFLRVATELVNFASGSYQVINIESVYQNARRGTKVKGWVGGVYWDIWLFLDRPSHRVRQTGECDLFRGYPAFREDRTTVF